MHSGGQEEIEVLISEQDLQTRLGELAAEIDRDYQGKDPIIIGVLQGAFVFVADLVRQMQIPLMVDFLRVSSYGQSLVTSGEVKILLDLTLPIAKRHVILVEDIIDTGITADYLRANLISRGPESVKICSLLQKPENLVRMVTVDYLGFSVGNRFAVGYGLDYAGRYRDLPYIGAVDEI